MTNDQANQAANVLAYSLDLIRQVLIKHESAVIAEFKSILEAKKHELQLIYAERDEWRDQAKQQQLRAEAAELVQVPNEHTALLKALGNCYTMARRELHKLRGESPPSMQRERWEHIKRFCEETGLREQILRASFPTELTDGG